jgi:predicted Zn-dependent protease
MRIEMLFWAGCPSHETALRELQAVLAEEGEDPDAVEVREVVTEGDVAVESFIGSPTIRIDGVDVQPEPKEPVGLSCRVYRRRDGRFSPTPDPDDLRDAVRRARASASAAAASGEPAAASADGEPASSTGGRR